MQIAGKFQSTDSSNRQQELARIAGQAWEPSYYTPDGSIRIEVSGVAPSAESLPGDWHATGMPENASLRVVGQSADGGLIWNTGAVSYAVAPPDMEVRALTNIVNSTTQPVYDPLTGLPTGYTTEADNVSAPTMRYGEQMRNVGAFVGTLGKNFSIGVAQGTIGLVSDAAKGWAMIGDLAFNSGSNVSRIDQFNLRPFEYDQGAGQFAGAVGEMFSPGAYARGAELGAAGLRALGPTADAAIYNYLQRSGGILGVVPEGAGINSAGLPATRSKNPLSSVLEFDAQGNEIMYRTMSEKQFEQLSRTGKLPPTNETSISPSVSYSSKYDGVTVKITVAPGTSAQLQEIGIAANGPAATQFPNMSTQTGNWMQTNARFKVEGGQMTTQLGQGRAIDIFNQNILNFDLVRK